MSAPYQRSVPPSWWLNNRNYLLFMLRELTSVFIAAFLVVYLVQLARLAQGAEAYTAFLQRLASPGCITPFNLTPKIVVVPMGEERVPPVFIVSSGYVAWLAISIAIVWIALRS
jgi:fumarate reductase subunit C